MYIMTIVELRNEPVQVVGVTTLNVFPTTKSQDGISLYAIEEHAMIQLLKL